MSIRKRFVKSSHDHQAHSHATCECQEANPGPNFFWSPTTDQLSVSAPSLITLFLRLHTIQYDPSTASCRLSSHLPRSLSVKILPASPTFPTQSAGRSQPHPDPNSVRTGLENILVSHRSKSDPTCCEAPNVARPLLIHLSAATRSWS